MSNSFTTGPEFNHELHNYNTDFDAVCFLNCKNENDENNEKKEEDIIEASSIVESFDDF